MDEPPYALKNFKSLGGLNDKALSNLYCHKKTNLIDYNIPKLGPLEQNVSAANFSADRIIEDESQDGEDKLQSEQDSSQWWISAAAASPPWRINQWYFQMCNVQSWSPVLGIMIAHWKYITMMKLPEKQRFGVIYNEQSPSQLGYIGSLSRASRVALTYFYSPFFL